MIFFKSFIDKFLNQTLRFDFCQAIKTLFCYINKSLTYLTIIGLILIFCYRRVRKRYEKPTWRRTSESRSTFNLRIYLYFIVQIMNASNETRRII